MRDYTQAVGRALLSAAFIAFGYIQFTNIGSYIANPAVLKFSALTGGMVAPVVIVYFVAAINLFGGNLILIGYRTRWASIVLIGFVVLTLLFSHNYWTMEGADRAANQEHFYKNLALIAGLLFLINLGPGRFSASHQQSLQIPTEQRPD